MPFDNAVRMEYQGWSAGSLSHGPAPSGHTYSAGKLDPYVDAHPLDVEWLEARQFVRMNLNPDGTSADQAELEAAQRAHEESARLAAEAEAERLRQEQERLSGNTNPLAFLADADISQAAAQALVDGGYTDAESIRAASDEELLALDGVGTATVFKLRQAFPVETV